MEQTVINDPYVPAAPLLPPNDPFNDFFSGARSPAEDASVNADIASVLASSVGHTTIAPAESDLVTLPVPVRIGDQLITTAVVRELTGADEEALAKADASGEPERMLDALLTAGVVALGSHRPNSQDILDLPVADRDALLIGIRRATYGPEVRFEKLRCQQCGEDFELRYDLGDVPSGQPMAKDSLWELRVSLRRGGAVGLRLPTGSDQMAVLEQIRTRQLNRAEQDTLIMGRCLLRMINAQGEESAVSDGVQIARSLSMADRSAIVREMDKNRPGPRLEEASVTCPACERSTEVPLNIQTLFRG
jgi:hypothetical protein